ncbi:MAG: recombinase family protein, partial [Boseongicola sp.]|nr:recombinase family protein [Boseongicola sp.]
FGTVRAVRDAADRMRLRTKERVAPSGRQSGGGLFDRGHIHHILTNPIYAGRIRHRTKVYNGQHAPIIDPDIWDAIQRQLQDKAAKRRSGRGATNRRHAVTSPLAGKVFDETGDRLTPTHSKTSSGKRLRYYVSRRLIQMSGGKRQIGWRLPAPDLEDLVVGKVRERLEDASRIATATGTHLFIPSTAAATTDGEETRNDQSILDLVHRVDIEQGQVTIALDADRVRTRIGADFDIPDQDVLTIQAPFRQRRRGVELKLIVDNPSSRRDDTLIRNVAHAHAWFGDLRTGSSYADIAKRAGTSKRRIMQVVELAFLAPDLTTEILDGAQPASLTSDLLIKSGVPSDWSDQRRFFDSLR